MFEDIAQMEKEIEEFRKNIIASSELVNSISDLTKATKEQKDSFTSSAEELLQKLDDCIKQFKTDHDGFLHTLETDNAASVEKMHQTIAADMQEWISKLENIKTAIESCEAEAKKNSDEQIKSLISESELIIDEMKKTMDAQQGTFLDKISNTEEIIRVYQADAESKYQGFVQRMESTNLEQILREVQDLKKTIKTKFTMIMIGIGIAVATGIIAIVGR